MLSVFIVFISAFLVFLIQPMVAKMLLPYFGGGSAVWTGCLLFFQTLLLLGYGYAHGLTKLPNYSKQKAVHIGLLSLAVLNAWWGFSDQTLLQEVSSQEGQAPLITLLTALLLTVGLPYFAVTTTGPLVQHWVAVTKQSTSPYRLYALSNIGSLLALISYPFVLEPSFTLPSQSLLWSSIFTLFAGLYITYLIKLDGQEQTQETTREIKSKVAMSTKLLWLMLSATGVIALIATTSAMTQNIPPVPFLWILPLVLYLLSFIITFNRSSWYVRWYWLGLFLVSAMIGLFMFFIGSQFDILTQVVMYSLILLSVCMICHGELEALKPETQHLTLFYVFMALGGFIGSAFVNFIAVEIFTLYYEFLLCLLLTAGVFLVCLFIPTSAQVTSPTQTKWMALITVLCVLGYGATFVPLNQQYAATDLVSSRNFYGILSVKDIKNDTVNERRLVDGTTSHGTQSLKAEEKRLPRSYYRYQTGVAMALQFQPEAAKNIGVVGLGAGTLAAYGRAQDNYVFYELNPDVERMANTYFSYLSDSPASNQVILGDARLSLQKQLAQSQPQGFDVLVVDAFSGDSIPVHLITEQALTLYWQHLTEQGILAFHISNSHLDLTPVLAGYAADPEVTALHISTPAQGQESHDVSWFLLTKNKAFVKQHQRFVYPVNADQPVLWTDDYSNLTTVLK